MAINKKLIFWKSSTFNPPTSPSDTTKDVLWNSIVFFDSTAGTYANSIWTHGKVFSSGVWGTNQTNYVPLAIGNTTYNLSKDGHTHSYLPLAGGTLTGQINLTTTTITTPQANTIALAAKSDGLYQKIGTVETKLALTTDLTWANITSKPTTLSGYGITDAVQINSDNWANFRYTEFALADKDVVINASGSIKLDGWYSISTGAGSSYGTRLTINGLDAHDKTQLYFNGENGSIQYRKSWYYNTPWTSFRTLWDSNNLTSLSQLTNDTGFITSSASITGNASSATKVNNNLILKFDTGTTEGTSLYTFDGSSAKTIDIKAGSNVSISKAAGIITISSTDTNTVYTHPTTSGNKHIPSGGSSGQILRWNSDGTAEWGTDNNNTYTAATTTNLGLTKLFSDTVQSIAGNTVTATASRTYGVQVNSSGQLVVNVPWVDTDNNTTYSQATSSTLGLVKLGSDTQQTVAASSVTATASRSYAIQLNSSGQMLVNVPWTDNNTTYAAGTSSTLGLMKLFSDTVQSVAATAVSATASRTYGVQVNSSGQLVVNVPWTDSNTTYSNFTGATGSANGTAGLVPLPTIANYNSNTYLKSNGTWTQVNYSHLTGTIPNAPSATYASAVTLTADNSTNAINYPLFVNVATGNLSPRTDTGFTYNPSTGALTASTFIGSLTGNASSATNLQTARTFAATGDATGSVSSNLSAGFSMALTLANSGVTAGTYKSVTVDAKGRVTAGTNPTTLGGYGITDAVTLNTAQSVTATKTFKVTQVFEKTITNTSPATQPIYIKGTGGSTVGTSPAIGFINPALNDGSIVFHNAIFKFMDWQMVTYIPVQSTKFDLGNGWDLRASGAELHFFYNGVQKGAFTTNGFVSTEQLTVNSSIFATGFFQSSDIRLKNVIEPLKIDIKDILNIPSFYFTYKDTERVNIGTSAQEVQKVFPEIVSTDSKGMLSVEYDKFGLIALELIKTQQKEIDSLKYELNNLKWKIDGYRN